VTGPRVISHYRDTIVHRMASRNMVYLDSTIACSPQFSNGQLPSLGLDPYQELRRVLPSSSVLEGVVVINWYRNMPGADFISKSCPCVTDVFCRVASSAHSIEQEE